LAVGGFGAAKGKGRDGVSLGDASRLQTCARRWPKARTQRPERQAEAAAGMTFGSYADAFLQSIKEGFKGRAGRERTIPRTLSWINAPFGPNGAMWPAWRKFQCADWL
jgi:hypothetical protein